VTPEEAELAKLFTNAWRYIKFAAANQFWLMSNESGLDFTKIREAIIRDYPRASDLPNAGFTAGPCLLKDTVQLAAFSEDNYALGHSAIEINEGLPNYVIQKIEEKIDLTSKTVGILGMAFKAESDDIRSSLAYKLKSTLQSKAKEVLTSDPFVSVDAELVGQDELLNRSDIIIIAAPHETYRELKTNKLVIDIWNLLGQGNLI
jgi:UDP-N-acetyl-D-mannosaminuronic acid dehydrogenase